MAVNNHKNTNNKQTKINKNSGKPQKTNGVKILPTLILIVFFLSAGLYLLWTYAVPVYLESKYDSSEICKYLSPRLGFEMKCESVDFYTTPALAVGANINHLILNYPSDTKEKFEFFKTKQLNIEIPLIPYLSKTIKFNKFVLKSLVVNLYQDETGSYPFIKQIQQNFNPEMRQYELVVPKIEIVGYAFKNFNAQTGEYKVISGKNKTISASTSKEVLEHSMQQSIKIK